MLYIALLAFPPMVRGMAQSGDQTSSPAQDTKTKPESRSNSLPENAKPEESPLKLLPAGEDPENRLLSPFIRHVAGDQKQFWTAPMRLHWSDAKVLAPFAGFTAALMATDAKISRQVPGTSVQILRSKNISDYATYSLIGAAGGSYLLGHFSHNDHLRETGFLAGEAALNSTAVTYLFKSVTQRPRPMEGNGNGTFFQGGASFPSEHSAIAWSVASVVAHEYPGTLTKIAAYGLASAVTLTRVTGKQHFPSEVVVGSALGWYFARQVYRAHHDPELGGTGWGEFAEDSEPGEKIRNPQYMGSPYVPLDSWVYPAVEKLASLGYIRTAFLALKPWTRMETANLVSEAKENLDAEAENAPAGIAGVQLQLEQEFAYETGLVEGKANLTAKIESIYARGVSISGSALSDSYHLGQTISYDYGRPFRRGTNGQIGTSMWAAAGPFTLYLRGEFQHAPSAPALPEAVRNVIGMRDLTPVPAGDPLAAVNRPHILEGYAAVNLGGWQVSAGKQSLDWGPGPGGSLLWSNNADPLEMVRIVKSDLRLPILGPMRLDQFFGALRGHSFVPHPYIYGQKINFKPLACLELGFGRTITIGGRGGDPLTLANFADSFFGRVNKTNSVPGDTHTSLDWIFHVPKTHNFLVFYGELYADDDPIPLQNPAKNPFRPGIFLTRFPGMPRLDLHVEAASTESPGFFNFGSTNHGNLNYWNQTYRDGYTNEGNLIGNTVGRMGRTLQSWLTYRTSPTSTVEFAYKHSTVSADFIPGGGAWQDYQFRYDKSLQSGLYWKSQVQLENISHYPLLFASSRRNLTAIVEFGWAPRHER
jgi:membrane-associated phospholipid phosphatase